MNIESALADPLAKRILSKALDRLDKSAGEARSRALRIALDVGTAPEIFAAGSNDDRELAWHVLEQLQASGFGKIHLRKAARYGTREEREPGFVVSTDPSAEDRLRTFYGRPRLGPGRYAEWRALVEASDLPDDIKPALAATPIVVRDRGASEVFEALLSIRRAHRPELDLMLREVSSSAFWGLSKVLDGRSDIVAALLGEEECPYPEQPVHLDVYFAGGCSWLLFIENKTSFERAIHDVRTAARDQRPSPYQGAALIYCSGFLGAARRTRRPDGARFFFNFDELSDFSYCPAFHEFVYRQTDAPAAFWGDLDYAGMAILAGLRQIFPACGAWEPGYAPMVARLLSGGGHSPEEAGKSGQRPVAATGCDYADGVLIPAILNTRRFFDQEWSHTFGDYLRESDVA